MHLNPANFTFLQAHQAELEALEKKYPLSDTDD